MILKLVATDLRDRLLCFFIDIGAVIHVAAGLPWKQDAEAMYNVREFFIMEM